MRQRRPHTAEDPLIEFKSLQEFKDFSKIPDGRFSIEFNGIPVDFFFEYRGYATTVVGFHGAILTTVDLPFHTAAGVMTNAKANRLAVSDPSLLFGLGLKLGWFAGSKRQIGLQSFVEMVIRSVNHLCKTEHLIFFGASGGGFSALEMSDRFPESLAIPMNPQTSITRYHPPSVALYAEVAWRGMDPFTDDQRWTRHNLVEAYPSEPHNTIAYIQNTRDRVHIRDHQGPFFDKVGKPSRVWQLMDAWGDPKRTGHTTPPKELVANIIEELAASNGEWTQGLVTAGFEKVTK